MRGAAVAAAALAGSLAALQAPINSALGKRVGSLPAATVSFAIGTVILVAVTLAFAGGFGRLGEARGLPWYYLAGGLLGAVYVTTLLITVRTLGAGGVTAAVISGQLLASVVIDRLGVLGIPEHALSGPRIAGIALLAAGTFLVVRY